MMHPRRRIRLRMIVAVLGMLAAGLAIRTGDHRLVRVAIGVLILAFLLRFIPVSRQDDAPAP